MKTISAVALVLCAAVLGAVTASAQENSCVYQYSFVNSKGIDSFAFCLTAYGTLASLQSPIGTEHLNPTNPFEGFEVFDDTGSVPVDLTIYPGFEVTQAPSSVTQPKGAGKLPIVFTYEGGNITNRDTITVSATPSERTVVFTMTVGKYVFQFNAGSGPVIRQAGLMVDGSSSNIFANSEYTSFAYNPTGHGVMLSGSFCAPPRSTCGQSLGYIGKSYGQNVVEEDGYFETLGESTDVFSYRVF
jgi:hypothetical protein